MYLYQFFLEKTEILEKFFCSGFLLTCILLTYILLTYILLTCILLTYIPLIPAQMQLY